MRSNAVRRRCAAIGAARLERLGRYGQLLTVILARQIQITLQHDQGSLVACERRLHLHQAALTSLPLTKSCRKNCARS